MLLLSVGDAAISGGRGARRIDGGAVSGGGAADVPVVVSTVLPMCQRWIPGVGKEIRAIMVDGSNKMREKRNKTSHSWTRVKVLRRGIKSPDPPGTLDTTLCNIASK
jgi:hypothetical protein